MKFSRIIATTIAIAMLLIAFPIPTAVATEAQQEDGGYDTPLSDAANKRCKAVFSKYGWDMSEINFMDNHDCMVYYNDITPEEAKNANLGTGFPGAKSPNAGYVVYAKTFIDIKGLRIAQHDKPMLTFVVRFDGRGMGEILEAAIRVSPSELSTRWFYSPKSVMSDVQKDVKIWYQKNHAVAKNDAQHVGFFGGYRTEYSEHTQMFVDFYANTKWKKINMNVFEVTTLGQSVEPFFSISEHQAIFDQCVKDGVSSAELYDDLPYALQNGIKYFFYSENAFKTTKGNRFFIDFCMTSEYDREQQRMALGLAWLVVKPISADAKKAYARKIFPVSANTKDIFAYVDSQVK